MTQGGFLIFVRDDTLVWLLPATTDTDAHLLFPCGSSMIVRASKDVLRHVEVNFDNVTRIEAQSTALKSFVDEQDKVPATVSSSVPDHRLHIHPDARTHLFTLLTSWTARAHRDGNIFMPISAKM